MLTGECPYLPELKKIAPKDVIFTGFKTGKELHEIYSLCDIFTFPSPFETLGNVVLDAMASGLPVVGMNEGGVKDNIHNSYNGYLEKVKDPTDFAFFVEIIMTDTHLMRTLSQNALAYSKTKNWKSIFKELIQNYGFSYNKSIELM